MLWQFSFQKHSDYIQSLLCGERHGICWDPGQELCFAFPIAFSTGKGWTKAEMFKELGVLTVLIFDPFLICASFLFVYIDHQKWGEKWTEKCELWTWPSWKIQKWDKKWLKYVFQHPSSLELHISLQTLLYLIASPIISVSLKFSLSLD